MRASGTAAIVAITLAIVMGGSGLVAEPAFPPRASVHAPLGATASSTALSPTRPAASSSGDSALSQRAMEAALRARGVPASDIHPPRWIRAADPHAPVAPTYTTGPAPMGISDLGLRNVSGTIVPYDYNTSSVWGSVTLTKAVAAYVDGDGPDTFGIQLNAVATGITLLGVPGYQFWTQDYVTYTVSTQNLSFGDNVWNFSNRSASFPNDVLFSHGPGGHPEAPYYYFAVGPSYTIAYPFTINLYLNATQVGGRPAVFFNYSLVRGGVFVAGHGTFDDVVFASSRGHSVRPAPAPEFQVNGTGLGPSALPNDFELVLVGNDDGDTTTFFAISASMSLEYWNSSLDRYRAVPAAYDAGSDTGETSNGLLPVTNRTTPDGPPFVTLRTGPSFVSGLWNVSRSLDGAREFKAHQHPQNAFLLISPGSSFDDSQAQWVPTQRFGTTTSNFWVPNTGAYSLEWVLSDRTPLSYSVTGLLPLENSTTVLLNVTLAVSVAEGSYTPLFAWGNADLAAIKQHGNGSAAAPYVLIHHPVGALEPVFGQLNDFGFPVFAGILLINTTAHVRILQPDVLMDYGSWEAPVLSKIHAPSSNELQLEFWNVSNVSVENSSSLSGWLTFYFNSFPVGSVVFWGSHGNLVANDTFYDQGASVALFGGRSNTIWGNRFLAGAVSAWFYEGNNTTGVLEAESGDLVYNNYFAVGQPAITPTLDPASCQVLCAPATYSDRWNVSLEPASASAIVLGYNLTGSIVRTSYQGGNYWSNYGTPANPLGVLPYNDSGLITVGGDYYPLYPSTIYSVTFAAHNLTPGRAWTVSVAGLTLRTTAGSQVFYGANGSYNYTVGGPVGFRAPANGTVNVAGANEIVGLNFTELFNVTFAAVGLPLGYLWNVSVTNETPNGTSLAFHSTATSGVARLANGTYKLLPAAYGYTVTLLGFPPDASPVVHGAPATFRFSFVAIELLTVTATGLAPGAQWVVRVTQGFEGGSEEAGVGDGAVYFTVLQLFPGAYSWTASAVGYTTSSGTGTGTTASLSSATVHFTSTASASSTSLGLWEAAFLGALAAAVAGFALAAVVYRRRPRSPPPITPAAVVAPAAPAGPAPWEESASDAENPEPYTARR